MAMTGYYKTFVRPRQHRPLSMLKYDPVGTCLSPTFPLSEEGRENVAERSGGEKDLVGGARARVGVCRRELSDLGSNQRGWKGDRNVRIGVHVEEDRGRAEDPSIRDKRKKPRWSADTRCVIVRKQVLFLEQKRGK